jgi:CheY-like chemotaxis protein
LNYSPGTETILLVDDEESLRAVVVDLLGQLGYRMLSAASGQEALSVAREYSGNIDLLITDVIMDGLAGPQLAEKLLQTRPDMEVIFISGYTSNALAPDGILKAGTQLVHKPFTIKILSAKVREVLGNPARK